MEKTKSPKVVWNIVYIKSQLKLETKLLKKERKLKRKSIFKVRFTSNKIKTWKCNTTSCGCEGNVE